MNLRPLILDDAVLQQIARVKEFARAHPIGIHELFRKVGANQPVGDDPHLGLLIPVGYRVVYSYEQQPAGWTHHLSVSVDEEGKWPHEQAVIAILNAFGIEADLSKAVAVFKEDEYEAINVIILADSGRPKP